MQPKPSPAPALPRQIHQPVLQAEELVKRVHPTNNAAPRICHGAGYLIRQRLQVLWGQLLSA